MKSISRLVALTALCVAIVISVGCERTVTRVEQVVQPQSCFNCHSDQNTALVAAEGQWLRSVHASGANIDHNSTLGGEPCQRCHTSEGFVAVAAGATIPEPVDNPTAIHCFTCHEPHTNNDFTLRITAQQSIQDGTSFDVGTANICVYCHQSRRDVNTYVVGGSFGRTTWGPHHSPQADMLFASNGYEYNNYSYNRFQFHLNAGDGCRYCHFDQTRNYVVGGHSFNMAWNADGEDIKLTEACLPCHDISDFDRNGVQTEVQMLADSLETFLFNLGLIDDTGQTVPSATADADTQGGVWNWLIVTEDRSLGIHNPWYVRDLLNSSIQFITGNLPQSTPAVVVEPQPAAIREREAATHGGAR